MNQERQCCQWPLLHNFHNRGLLVVLRMNWVLSDIFNIKYWVFTVCYNRSGSARVVWCSSVKQSKADVDGVCLLQCVFATLYVCVLLRMNMCVCTCVLECVCMRMCVCVCVHAFVCSSVNGLLTRVGTAFVTISVDVCHNSHAVWPHFPIPMIPTFAGDHVFSVQVGGRSDQTSWRNGGHCLGDCAGLGSASQVNILLPPSFL